MAKRKNVISDADLALLCLLSECPMHPWQIEKTVRERDMRFWTDLSQATIYRQLRALLEGGLVRSKEEVQRGKIRKVYTISASGRAAVKKKLVETLSVPQHVKWRLDLGTYNVDLLDKKEAVEALKAYKAKVKENIKGYGDLEKFMTSCGCPTNRLAVARRAVRLLEGDLKWAEEFIREIGGK